MLRNVLKNARKDVFPAAWQLTHTGTSSLAGSDVVMDSVAQTASGNERRDPGWAIRYA